MIASLILLTVPTGDLPDAASSPWVVRTVVAAACVTAVLLAAARVVEPLGEAWEKLRRYRQRSEDARIKDMSEQVDHLAGRVYTLEQQQLRQDRYLLEHAKWDHELMMAAINAGLEVSEPPPLRAPLEAP